jgi:hypothetical protein
MDKFRQYFSRRNVDDIKVAVDALTPAEIRNVSAIVNTYLHPDARSVLDSYLDFETLVNMGSKQAFEAFDPEQHTWMWAAETGKLNVLKWLHANRIPYKTYYSAIVEAATVYGHLDIVKWFFANGLKRTVRALTQLAAEYGHLDIVKWLHANGKGKYYYYARKSAVLNGHLDIVDWFDSLPSRLVSLKTGL